METTTLESKTKPLTSAAIVFKTKGIYIMHYRIGNRKPETKAFLSEGSHQDAINRARAHCQRMKNYRFCGCYPFLVDLDIQEEFNMDEITYDHNTL